MERQLGEKFDYNGVTLKVVKDKKCCCDRCYFGANESSCSYEVRDAIGPCGEYTRSDGLAVIFKKLKGKKSVRSPKE